MLPIRLIWFSLYGLLPTTGEQMKERNEISSEPLLTEQPTLASRVQRLAARHLVGVTKVRKPSREREVGARGSGEAYHWGGSSGPQTLLFPTSQTQSGRFTSKPISVRVLGKETHWYLWRLHAKISSGCEADSFRVIAGPWRCWLLLTSHDAGLQGNSVRCLKCLVTLKRQNTVAQPKWTCLL